MQDTLAKKIFAIGSAAAMVAALGLPLMASAAVHTDGTNVSDSTGTVYMVVGGQLRPYTSAGAFLSYGFNSWSGVTTASAEDLALPKGNFIPPQDGKIFCATATKGSDVKGECALVTGGQKASFTSAAVFTGLGFSFARAQSGDSSFLNKTANVDNSTAAHLPGVLINKSGTVYLVGNNGLLGIPDLATFNSWGYSFSDVVTANAADSEAMTGVMATRVAGQLSPVAQVPGTTNPSGVVSGSVSAALSSDTPVAGTLVSGSCTGASCTPPPGQTGADVAHFTFTGTGTVTQVVVKRIGVSADTSLNNVYLYQGNNRITDAGSLSNGQVTFGNSTGLFTVNGTAEITVKVDVAGGVSGQTIGMQLASYTVANGTPISTSISGNLFNTASVSNLASVSITATSAVTGPGASINAGSLNAVLWSVPVNVGQRNVLMKYIAFKQLGSVAQSAIQNLKLFVDGAQVGSTASITNNGANSNVVVFDLTGSPVTLGTGSHTIELHGDVVNGSSYTFDFSLQQASDVVFYDTSYNVNVPFTVGASGAQVSQLSPVLTTISAGSISVSLDPSFTSTQFVTNQSQVVLGQWTMKAYGEDVKVQNLKVKLHYGTATGVTGDGFNNLSLFVNGGQVGSSLSALGTAQDVVYPFGSSNLFTIPAGTTVTVAVKGDSVLASTDAIGSVLANLIVPQNSLQGVASFALSPTADQTYTGVTLTTGASSATFAQNTAYATNQNISSNSTKQKIGSYVIQAGSNDGVRVSSVVVGYTGSTLPMTSLANVYIVTPDMPNGSTPVATPTVTTGTNNFTTNFTVAANQTATIDVYADIGTSPAANPNFVNTNSPSLTDAVVVVGTSGGTEVHTVTVGSDVQPGNTYVVKVGSNASTTAVTAVTSDNASSIAIKLAAAVNAITHTGVNTAGSNGAMVTLVASSSSAPFTVATAVTTGTQSTSGGGTVITTMQGQGTGTTSNQVVYLTLHGASTDGPVTGQSITIGTGSIATAALNVSASPVPQFVIGASQNQPVATYTFVSGATGGANITELGFDTGVTSNVPITSVMVSGKTAAVVGGKALVTGLSLVVPVGNSGLDVPVTVNYATVGTGGVNDGASQLTLVHVRYTSGNSTVISGTQTQWGDSGSSAPLNGSGVGAKPMYLVGSAPTVAITASTNALTVGAPIVGSVTVTANAAGKITLSSLPLTFATSSGVTVGLVTLIDHASGNVAGTSTIAGNLAVVTLNNYNSISAGQSVVYDVQVAVSATPSSTGASVAMGLGDSGSFTFVDVNGNHSPSINGKINSVNYIASYPTTQVSIHN